jgi:hypothetical protein
LEKPAVLDNPFVDEADGGVDEMDVPALEQTR